VVLVLVDGVDVVLVDGVEVDMVVVVGGMGGGLEMVAGANDRAMGGG